MTVRFTPAARSDMIAIGDWIARYSPIRAATFVEELMDRARTLADQPEAFEAVPGRPDIRRRPHRDYLIFYRIEPGAVVVVLRVLHGARDHTSLLN